MLGSDMASAVDGFTGFFSHSLIIKAEIRTSTEIAVEILHVMTFFVFGIERAEIRLLFYHALESKIGDDFLGVESTR